MVSAACSRSSRVSNKGTRASPSGEPSCVQAEPGPIGEQQHGQDVLGPFRHADDVGADGRRARIRKRLGEGSAVRPERFCRLLRSGRPTWLRSGAGAANWWLRKSSRPAASSAANRSVRPSCRKSSSRTAVWTSLYWRMSSGAVCSPKIWACRRAAPEAGVRKRPGAGLVQALVEPVQRFDQVRAGLQVGQRDRICLCLRTSSTWPSSRPVTSSAEAAARSSASTAA